MVHALWYTPTGTAEHVEGRRKQGRAGDVPARGRGHGSEDGDAVGCRKVEKIDYRRQEQRLDCRCHFGLHALDSRTLSDR